MTCFISHPYNDRVEVLVDTAIWRSDTLAVTALASKAVPIAGLPLVMTSRGDMGLLMSFAGQVMAAGSVDAAVAAVQKILTDYRASGSPVMDGQDFLLAGWSETRGPICLYAGCTETPMFGEPWELTDAPGFLAGTPLTQYDFDEAGFYEDQFRNGLHHYGVKLLQEVRVKCLEWEGKPLIACGGTLLLVTITPNGVSSKTLGGWHDMVGVPMVRDAPYMDSSNGR